MLLYNMEKITKLVLLINVPITFNYFNSIPNNIQLQYYTDWWKHRRGVKAVGLNKTPQTPIELIIDVINRLPKYESHYRRKSNSNVLYLQPGMTVPKIYDLYKIKFDKKFGIDEKWPFYNILSKGLYKNSI